MAIKIVKHKSNSTSTETNTVFSKIKKVQESVDKTKNLKVVVYGRSGTGKTTFSGTFPKPLLHIVCSSIGLNESIPLAKIDGIYDFLLEKGEELLEIPTIVEEMSFKTVVLDHATGLQDLILKEILGVEEIIQQKNFGMVTQAQYGQLTFQMKQILYKLLSCNCNVVVVSQEKEIVVDDVSGLLTPYVSTALTPSVSSWLHAAADFVLHTYIKQKTSKVATKVGKSEVEIEKAVSGYSFCIHIAPNPVFVTKIRTQEQKELPEYIENPTYEKLLELVR